MIRSKMLNYYKTNKNPVCPEQEKSARLRIQKGTENQGVNYDRPVVGDLLLFLTHR